MLRILGKIQRIGIITEPLPKIEVARMAISKGELVCGDDPLLLAVVSDFVPARSVARFAFDDQAGVADLIWTKVLGRGAVAAT